MIRGATRKHVNRSNFKKEMTCSLHNRFDIEVVDSVTGKVKERAQAENIILNKLWTYMFAPSTWFNYIHFGTGAGTPAVTDTTLFTFLAGVAGGTATYTYDFDEKWVSAKRTIQLSETQYVGSTITEVGIGYSATSSTLCTHAMLKDMNGNSISITKSNTDIINIYATVFAHWHDVGGDDSISIVSRSGNNILLYMLGLQAGMTSILPAYICAETEKIYGKYAYSDTSYAGSVAYNATNKTATFTAQRLAAGVGNMAYSGIRLISMRVWNALIFSSDLVMKVGGTWFSGSTIVGEAIATGDGSIKDFKTAFGFLKSGAKIYVDGVEQTTGVTVNTGRPINNLNIGAHFTLLPEYSSDIPCAIGFGTGNDGATGSSVWYNPWYELGVLRWTAYAQGLRCSDDLENWVTISASETGNSGSGSNRDVTIDEAYRHYKYWNPYYLASSYSTEHGISCLTDLSNIHFDTAPASGAVITADYTTETIAKDANHVFDFSFVLTFAEYVA